MNAFLVKLAAKALPYLETAGRFFAGLAVLAFNFARAHVADTILVLLLGAVFYLTDSRLLSALVLALVGVTAYVAARNAENIR